MLDTSHVAPAHALQQDPAFFEALKYCGQAPVILPGGLTLLSRRLLGLRVAMLPRAVPPTDLAAQLASVGLARCPLILSPERECLDIEGMLTSKPVRMASIDLTGDTAVRRAALHSKWRNQLCRAEEGPLRIRSAPLKPNDPILRQEEVQSRARRNANWPCGLSSAFAQVARDQTRLYTAFLGGMPVAHVLFLLHGCRATYQIGLTTADGRAHNAHNLLLWNATRWLATSGHTALDLGPLHNETHSLNRFKLRAGARTHLTGGTWLRWRPIGR